MKIISAKNIFILLLVASNLGLAAYVFVNRGKLFNPAPGRTKALTARKSLPVKQSQSYREGVVRDAIREQSSELESCYNRYLATDPAVTQGGLTISWQIDPTGSVSAAALAATDINDSELISCVLAQIDRWHFSPPPSDQIPVLVAHRFTFRPRATTAMEF